MRFYFYSQAGDESGVTR
ncbi:TPA: hypothetical protein JLT77_001169 [Escherichia coli]|nr:hypothetical protein [Escherichia coli]